MSLVLVGTSHRLAPVELRELVALGEKEAADVAHMLAAGGWETVCLSTCNRTELYLASDDAEAAEQRAAAVLRDLPVLYRLHDHAAALHLFRVAAGLDSLVPGEGEILGQVRKAAEIGAPGPLLDRLFRDAVHAGRRVRSQTAISESPASISSAAAALAQQVFGDLAGRKILVIGAGKVSEQAARNLVSRGAAISAVANRSVARAEELAGRFGARAVPLEQAQDELTAADVVVSSTSAGGFVLEQEGVHGTLGARRGRPLFLIDLALPRDIDPEAAKLANVYLYNLDDLAKIAEGNLAQREAEVARCRAIIAERTAALWPQIARNLNSNPG